MNYPRAIAKATVLALFMVISVSFIARTHANGPPNESDIAVVEDLDLKSQMGFYDLLSEQEEVYDVRMFPGNNSFLISITTPSDSRFIMKGDMKLEKNKSGGTDFKFLPIYYNSPQKNRLIDSLIDGTTNRIMLLNSFQNEKNQVIISQNGLVFVHPKSAKLEYTPPLFKSIKTTTKPLENTPPAAPATDKKPDAADKQ